jgi:hypothetical protein
MISKYAQVIFFVLVSASAQAQDGTCFDFSKKITEPLKKPATLRDLPYPEISKKSGQSGPKQFWAEVRGRVPRGVDSILEEIKTHETLKSKRVSSMSIDTMEQPGYLARQKVHYKVEPFPFMTVEWTEDWGYTALGKSILISYEKTEGTSHIPHLCGSIVLTPIDPATADVFIYEEAEATGRSREDTLNGVIGTLKTFRSPQK